MDDFHDRRKERMRWRHRQDQEQSRKLFDAILKDQLEQGGATPLGIPALLLDGALFRLHA